MKSALCLMLLAILCSCNSDPKHPQAKLISQSSPVPITEVSILAFSDSVDASQNHLKRQTSLVYQLDNTSTYAERFTWNDDYVLYKEHTTNESISNKTTRYYFKNNSLILIKENISRAKGKENIIEEKRIFLRNNISFKWNIRSAQSFAALQKTPFRETEKFKDSIYENLTDKIKDLNDMLSGQNKFEMVFDRFISSPEAQYLIFKSKTSNGYNASVFVARNDDLIDSILKDPSIFYNQKMHIKWEVVDKEAVYVPVSASVTSAKGLNK